MVRSPFAADTFYDPAGVVVVSSPDGHDTESMAGIGSLPGVVIAIDREDSTSLAWADVIAEDGVATVDDILRGVTANPVAATSLVLLLRSLPASRDDGLIAESAVYSALQSGTEFAAWRAAGGIRPERSEAGPTVRVERDGEVLVLTLDRPQVRNAFNRAMRDELLAAFTISLADPSVSSVVLRGEGPSFCSGGDLSEFGRAADPASAHLLRLATSVGRPMELLGQRLLAHVHGPCAGSGVELPAFAARVEAENDFTCVLPEVGMGLIPGAGGTVSITGRIGRHRTALLALTGATIDAVTARQWGMVDDVVPGR